MRSDQVLLIVFFFFFNKRNPICRSLIGPLSGEHAQGLSERARATGASLRTLIDSRAPQGQINTEVC